MKWCLFGFFFVLRWLLNIFSLHLPLRHMKEISELQAFQRSEIERLYKELGKTLPPNVSLLHAAPPSGRRRKASKHKLKAGKLLNPMVQQLKNNLNTTSADRKGMWVGNVGWWVAMYPCDVMICVYGRVFAACGEHRNDIRFRKLVGVCDSFWLTLYFFIYLFSLCAKVRVLPARPAPRLKVQFYQMAQPTPAAAPAPAISRALPQSMSTPSSPVLWRVLSPQTTSTLDYMVMEIPTMLALVKVHIIGSWVCVCAVCVWSCRWTCIQTLYTFLTTVNGAPG